jgi:hypothetical protein
MKGERKKNTDSLKLNKTDKFTIILENTHIIKKKKRKVTKLTKRENKKYIFSKTKL